MVKLLELRFVFLSACVLFRIALDLCYVIFINPVFSYLGFSYNLSVDSYFFSWLIYIFCLSVTPHLLNKVSDYFLALFFLAIIAPLSSITSLASAEVFPLLVTVSVFLFFRAFQYGSIFSRLMPVPRVKNISDGRIISLTLSFTSVFVLVSWYFYSGAFRYFNLNLLKVYDFRDASSELARVGFFNYFNGWVYNIFSIFLMSYCLWKKKFFFFFLLFGVQIFFYGVSNHKGVLFYPIMILGIWFYSRRSRALSVIPLSFLFIVAFCLWLYISFDHIIAGSFFIRRVFFIPAKLTLDYFSFFSLNDFIWWSNSVLSGFIEYPYNLSLGQVIGEYVGSSGSSANNGFIASGYAHAGLFGVTIYAFIFTYFLKFLDHVVIKSDIPVWLALCITIVPFRAALISSDLFTTMLTHGLALSLLMLILFRRTSVVVQSKTINRSR